MSLKDMFESEVFFFYLLLAIVLIFFVSVIVTVIGKGKEHSLPTNEKSNLKVISKETVPHQLNSSVILYTIVFESETGNRISLNAPNRETYSSLVNGDIVDVVYQGEKLLSFTRKK